MVELADTPVSRTGSLIGVRVRVLLGACERFVDMKGNQMSKTRTKSPLKSEKIRVVAESTAFVFEEPDKTVYFQMDESGMIRLQVSGEEAGFWSCYQHPVEVAAHDGTMFIGLGFYFTGVDAPRIYRIESEGRKLA